MSKRSASTLGPSMCRPPREMQNDAGSGAGRRYHFEPRADQAGTRGNVAQALTSRADLLRIEADAVVARLEIDAVHGCLQDHRGAGGTRVAQTVAHRFASDAKNVMRLLRGELRGRG